jgi:hypothetical protein
MNQRIRTTFKNPVCRKALLPLCCAVLTIVGCDNDVNFNPAAPTFPLFEPVESWRTLEIDGTLRSESEQGSGLEATVLYDGRELEGARVTCASDSGCTELRLTATVRTQGGHHTISFQVLSQSVDSVEYRAEGTVRVRRDGLAWVLTLPLRPTRATLRSGGRVDFELDLLD